MEIIKENFSNLARIWVMAKLNVKEEFRHAKLGIFWEILRTAVFFTIYSVFYYFVRNSSDINKIIALTSVLLPFNLIVQVINQTPRVYKKNRLLVTSIKFPLSIMPTYDIVAKYIIHIITLLIVLVIHSIFKHISYTAIQIIYYYISLFALLTSLMFVLSLLCSISDDAHKLWQVVTRIFIYINPIFWSVSDISKREGIPEIIITIIKLNPFVYILEGFRKILASENYNTFTDNHLELLNTDTLIFWLTIILLYFFGFFFQRKLRRILPDVI